MGKKKGDTQFIGSARALKPWLTLESDRLIGVGTSLKYYIEDGGVFYDITPIRETTAAGDVTFLLRSNYPCYNCNRHKS